MGYIQGDDRRQQFLLPPSIDEYVDESSPVRVLDAFVDGLDLEVEVVSVGEAGSDAGVEAVSSGKVGSVVSSVFAVVTVGESPFDGSLFPFPLSHPPVIRSSDATNRQRSIRKVFDLRAIVFASLGYLYCHLITVLRGIELIQQNHRMT